ncbi:hypothetical protein J437_LFUL005930 [Ladona fulva]|uniref:Ig-like domain-containing protein n=1 Tax=Ladona fulva TaxID=123851 RepID=A0A8K0JZN5_LADFU|nr:hypothetical protein J437_LFUL005930 [Ladona fulva]
MFSLCDTEARAEIIGAPDLHLKSGSTLRLSCVLRQSTEPPVYVFWYHDDRMINYDRERGVSVEAERFGSALVVREARRVDSGNYTCVPSNARPASVNVHVLNGKTNLSSALSTRLDLLSGARWNPFC